MKKLNLMTVSELTKPIENALTQLEQIKIDIAHYLNENVINGIFLMTIAYYESSLNDILLYYFKCFPEKLDFNKLSFDKDEKSFYSSNVSFTKEDIFNNDLIELEIEKKIQSLSYSKLEAYMENFCKILSISEMDKHVVKKFIEYKERRNLLVHNNLKVNYKYLKATNSSSKELKIGEQLKIEKKYLLECIENTNNLLKKIKYELTDKYKLYTHLKVIEDLWAYLFSSPILKFKDYWEIDRENDRIICMKKYNNEGALSKSEKLFLGVLRAHYSGSDKNLEKFNMFSLDEDNKRKMLYLLNIITIINLQH